MHDEMIKDFRNAELNFQKEHRTKQVSKSDIQLWRLVVNCKVNRLLSVANWLRDLSFIALTKSACEKSVKSGVVTKVNEAPKVRTLSDIKHYLAITIL